MPTESETTCVNKSFLHSVKPSSYRRFTCLPIYGTNELPYSQVASVAMKNYTESFTRHDETRFKECLDSVKKGKAKIAAGALYPHEIIAQLKNPADSDTDSNTVAELQSCDGRE